MMHHPHLNFPIRLYPDSVGAWRPLREPNPTPHTAKRARFSTFSFLKFQIPHFAIPNQIPPFRPFRPLRPLREISGFTLIELMAATTVLSVILLMMVGMQDQMSKAWSNSNRRTDATREARVACRLMAQDLTCLVFRKDRNDNVASTIAPALTNRGIPFLYSSNGAGSLITIPSPQSSASYFFGISSRKASGANPGDLAIVGYYIASATTTNVNGFTSTTYNLYRHYVPASNAVNNLNAWFASKTPTDLFDPTNPEILARNTCNLRITVYNKQEDPDDPVTNGLNYTFNAGGSNTYYAGNKIQVEMSVYPEDFAQKIPYTDWGKSENIRKYSRSYEFRVDVPAL
jgi:prepilin-type N-terminal cleavage/methylation domain-containing protein